MKLAAIDQRPDGAYNLTRAQDTPPQYPWVDHCRFYAVNALGLLDAPGEYLVGSNGTLWLLPPAGADPRASGAAAEVSVAPHALTLDGAQNVTVANLSVATTTATAACPPAVAAAAAFPSTAETAFSAAAADGAYGAMRYQA